MNKLIDPGKDKITREEAKAARLAAWKRPITRVAQEKARAERLKDWSEKYGNIDSADKRTLG